MKHSLALEFTGVKTPSNKDASTEGEDAVYSAIASTPALDRYKEVLLPLGMEYEAFNSNPVMLMLHDHMTVPVGKVLEIRVSKESVEFDFVFADSDNGREVQKMYDTGFMNAFSVGLYPKSYKYIDEDTPDQIEVEVADGKKQKIDLTVYKERPQYVVNQWELLEISPVAVPANPEALLKREAAAFMSKSFDGKGASEAGAIGQIFAKRLDAELNKVLHILKRFESSDVEASLAVVPKHTCSVVEDAEWSRASAMVDTAKACSEDGSGDKEKINWGDFSKSFAWVDVEHADKLSAYEYPHHAYKDGELVVTVLGMQQALSKLLKDKESDTLIMSDDYEDIYAHLKKHYEDAALEIPEFDKTYSEEELLAIAEGTWKAAPVESDPSGDDAGTDESNTSLTVEPSVEIKQLQEAVSALASQIKEFEQGLNIRLGIQFDLVTDLKAKLTELTIKPSKGSTDPENLEPEEGKEFSEAFDVFMAGLTASVN